MKFQHLSLTDAVLVEIAPLSDERGFFARSFCEEEFAAAGLPTQFPQMNISSNTRKGTVRGMHFQAFPHEEPKLVRCIRGAIHDVIIDLRPQSPTYCQSLGVELNEDNHTGLYVPPGFAHGFQTLADSSVVLYLMGNTYHPESARGVRWNDPAFSVIWPVPISVISHRDATYPDFKA